LYDGYLKQGESPGEMN